MSTGLVRTGVILMLVCSIPIGIGMMDDAGTRNVNSLVIKTYEGRHGTLSAQGRDEVVDNARQACHFLDTDPSLPRLWGAMTDSGVSSDAAATTIEAAITYICRQHEYLLT